MQCRSVTVYFSFKIELFWRWTIAKSYQNSRMTDNTCCNQNKNKLEIPNKRLADSEFWQYTIDLF